MNELDNYISRVMESISEYVNWLDSKHYLLEMGRNIHRGHSPQEAEQIINAIITQEPKEKSDGVQNKVGKP
jgi:hypothetical protein